jgi:anti-sigma factor RsiW
MTINRNNYEEFFLLYVDQELSDADRRAVEIFVSENPDLEQELSMLQGTRISPDESISFADKDALLRPSANDFPVGLANIRELFLLYVDQELGENERKSVEEFAAQHPQLQHELKLLKQTVIEPDTEVRFERKEELYREEKERALVRFRWVRYAAAAVFIIIAGFLVFQYFSKREPAKSLAKSANRSAKAIYR